MIYRIRVRVIKIHRKSVSFILEILPPENINFLKPQTLILLQEISANELKVDKRIILKKTKN